MFFVKLVKGLINYYFFFGRELILENSKKNCRSRREEDGGNFR